MIGDREYVRGHNRECQVSEEESGPGIVDSDKTVSGGFVLTTLIAVDCKYPFNVDSSWVKFRMNKEVNEK